MTGEETGGNRDPTAAFEALADERRLGMLRALYRTELAAETPEEGFLSFSGLYEHTEFEDTATFTYHLDKLVGTYLASDDKGYRLTATGERVVQAVLGGLYTDEPSFERSTVDATCPNCSHSPVEFGREGGLIVLQCPACSQPFLRDNVQPALLADRSPAEALRAYDRTIRRKIELALDGVCPECSGEVSLDLQRSPQQVALSWLAVSECTQCNNRGQFPPYHALLFHPVVISFYWDCGVDLTDQPYWRVVEFVLDGEWEPAVVDTDPFACRVDIHCEGDTLTVTLDEDLRVSDATLETSRDILPTEENNS